MVSEDCAGVGPSMFPRPQAVSDHLLHVSEIVIGLGCVCGDVPINDECEAVHSRLQREEEREGEKNVANVRA